MVHSKYPITVGDLRYHVYKAEDGEWWWRATYGNGNKAASSGEGFGKKRSGGERALKDFFANFTDTTPPIEGSQ